MAIIEGDPRYIPNATFKPKIEECLKLLRDHAGAYSAWFSTYNLKIRAAERSGANFQDNAIDIALPTFEASETWLASVIIHETVHFWQYRDGHYQAGKVAEQEANKYQLAVLRCLAAPQFEITHMLSQDGGHADLDGDGVYTWQDYYARKY